MNEIIFIVDFIDPTKQRNNKDNL